ncbi:hypothetical protein ACFY93_21720 [Streptomyces sp. NPDC008313]
MTRAKKILATLALVLGAATAATTPALADNSMPTSPQGSVTTPADTNTV